MIVCVFVVSVRSRPSEAQIVSPFPFRPLLCESHLFQSKTPLWFGDLHRQVVPRAARSKDSSVQQLAYMSSFVDIFPTAFDSFGFCFLGGTVSLSFPCSQSVFVDHPLLFLQHSHWFFCLFLHWSPSPHLFSVDGGIGFTLYLSLLCTQRVHLILVCSVTKLMGASSHSLYIRTKDKVPFVTCRDVP